MKRARWEVEYAKQYSKKHNNLNSEWGHLTGVMLAVSVFALTLFPSIILVARANSYAVAASISIFVIGTGASVCTGIYYWTMSDKNENLLNTMPNWFPRSFEVFFKEKRLQRN